MDIVSLVSEALKDLNIPNFYMKKQDDIKECIVYSYIEKPGLYGDMKEIATKYTLLLNVYTEEENLENTKEYVKKAMRESGFKKIIIPISVLEKNGLYNTAMQFEIGIKN